MFYSENDVAEVCAGLVQRHFELCGQARLNRGTGCAILGVSRSRYNQWRKKPRGIVQAHIFLNLIEANDRVKRGLQQGWLPATAERGKPQEEALERLKRG